MKLSELKKQGGVIAETHIEKEVKWVNAEGEQLVFNVFVRKMSFGDVEKFWDTKFKEDESKTARYISQFLRLGEKGDEILSYNDAFQLEPVLAGAFLNAIKDVNKPVAEDKKKLKVIKKSGTN